MNKFKQNELDNLEVTIFYVLIDKYKVNIIEKDYFMTILNTILVLKVVFHF